ncbi:hypothetical protein FS749_009542 [Ceratobasidium sp. UAMH 11750]|nr:hypothetical protein FS749_009542 [Ceratobasidium sp. UAMH 11750]
MIMRAIVFVGRRDYAHAVQLLVGTRPPATLLQHNDHLTAPSSLSTTCRLSTTFSFPRMPSRAFPNASVHYPILTSATASPIQAASLPADQGMVFSFGSAMEQHLPAKTNTSPAWPETLLAALAMYPLLN